HRASARGSEAGRKLSSRRGRGSRSGRRRGRVVHDPPARQRPSPGGKANGHLSVVMCPRSFPRGGDVRTKVIAVFAGVGLVVATAWLVGGSKPPEEIPASASQPDPDASQPEPDASEIVKKGLGFLARSQREDGHWEEKGGARPVETTALAGI